MHCTRVVILALSGCAATAAAQEPSIPERAPRDVLYRLRAPFTTATRDRVLESVHAVSDQALWGELIHRLVLPDGTDLDAVLARLRADPRLLYAEPNGTGRGGSIPNDPMFSQQWSLSQTNDADIDAPEAWDVARDGSTVVVAVIDSGVDYTHPDLAGNIWTNPAEIAGNGIDDDANGWIDDVHGIDTVDVDGDPQDGLGHGTHVAGTIGAVGNNGVGIAGVCHDVQLMALRFINSANWGWYSDAILCINYAVAHGVRISNHSWGGTSYSQALLDAINLAGGSGHLLACAAMNAAGNNDVTPWYPATYSAANILSVAATTSTDGLASFSNWGPTSVDLGAPGDGILSTLPGNRYASWSGTSMATPHVTGVAALLLAAAPDATYAQLESWILDSVDPLTSLQGKCVTGGRLNFAKALGRLPPPPWSPSQLFTVTGTAAGAHLGQVVALTADIDGDGIRDLLLGAPGDVTGGSATGSAALHSGADGHEIHKWFGDSSGESCGRALADAGDLDGDGTPDVIVGAPDDATHGANTGEAALYSGRTGALLRKHTGASGGGFFGFAVCGCGDVNHDGRADVAVGAHGSNAVYVYSGSDGALLRTISKNPRKRIGSAVAPAGDVDGDGTPDLLVGVHDMAEARIYSLATGNELATFSNYGGAEIGAPIGATGDLNGDSIDDFFVARNGPGGQVDLELSSGGSWNAISLQSPDSQEFFASGVAAIGDLDGDGVGDLLVGARDADAGNGARPGAVRAFSGRDATLLRTVWGGELDEEFGTGVAGGDLDGNGVPDLVAGAPKADSSSADDGEVRVFTGADLSLTIAPRAPLALQPIEFLIAGGERDQLCALAVTDISDTATFLLVLVAPLGDFGRLELSSSVPPGLAGITTTLWALATRANGGPLRASNRESVWFR